MWPRLPSLARTRVERGRRWWSCAYSFSPVFRRSPPHCSEINSFLTAPAFIFAIYSLPFEAFYWPVSEFMANPGDFAYTLKQQTDIVRVVGEYVKLKKAGAQNYAGLCPFHSEKTASFSVHATRQFYHCFGCGLSGDVFSFVQKIENITFPEAVRLVAQKLGIPLPKVSYATEGEAKEARLRGQLLDVHERAVAFFQECLRRSEGASAREYLKGRGLNDELVARFRIGYAPDSGFLLRDRLKGEFSEEVLRESGLFSWKEAGSPAASPESRVPSPENPASSDVRASGLRTKDSGLAPGLAMYSKFRNRVMFP